MMSKEPRKHRVPIMLSDEELKALDDWRFGNRVSTRSDAIRRLIVLGMSAENGEAA